MPAQAGILLHLLIPLDAPEGGCETILLGSVFHAVIL